MTEQGAVLFLNEDDGVWELVSGDEAARVTVWEAEADALWDLTGDGWKIEGPFRMCPKLAGLPKVWFIGYGLTRLIQ